MAVANDLLFLNDVKSYVDSKTANTKLIKFFEDYTLICEPSTFFAYLSGAKNNKPFTVNVPNHLLARMYDVDCAIDYVCSTEKHVDVLKDVDATYTLINKETNEYYVKHTHSEDLFDIYNSMY